MTLVAVLGRVFRCRWLAGQRVYGGFRMRHDDGEPGVFGFRWTG